MSVFRGENQSDTCTYDFDTDGGAQGTFTLGTLPTGVIIKDFQFYVETAATSGGSATITYGNAADPDGYMADTFAAAGSDNDAARAGEIAGDLVWDDTNDHAIYHTVVDAADGQFIFTITTADLTAGKIIFMVHFLYPSI